MLSEIHSRKHYEHGKSYADGEKHLFRYAFFPFRVYLSRDVCYTLRVSARKAVAARLFSYRAYTFGLVRTATRYYAFKPLVRRNRKNIDVHKLIRKFLVHAPKEDYGDYYKKYFVAEKGHAEINRIEKSVA